MRVGKTRKEGGRADAGQGGWNCCSQPRAAAGWAWCAGKGLAFSAAWPPIRSQKRDPQQFPDESRGRAPAGQLADLFKIETCAMQVGLCVLKSSLETFINNAPLFSPYIYRKDNLILARGHVRREDIKLRCFCSSRQSETGSVVAVASVDRSALQHTGSVPSRSKGESRDFRWLRGS